MIIKCAKSRLLVLCLFLVFTSPVHGERPDGPSKDIRVGVFPFSPFSRIGGNGEVSGLFPDILNEIYREGNHSIEYVPGTWSEGLERLEKGEIDLMICVAYTEERDRYMDFNMEPVAELWSQVFVRPENKSVNINDLEGRTVGLMERDINGEHFLETAARFGVTCEIRYFPTHDDIFQSLSDGLIDAGVAPQHYGFQNASSYGLIPSGIIFSPFSIYFTTGEGRNGDILNLIDSRLIRWKGDKDSFYYKCLYHWLGYGGTDRAFIPHWLLILFGGIILISLLLILNSLFMKRTIAQKTGELLKKNEELKQNEKLSAIGRLAGGVAHDFNNQLMSISGFAELIASRSEDGEIRLYAENILRSVERSADLTRKLLSFARKGALVKRPVELNGLIRETGQVMERSMDKSIMIELKCHGEDLVVRGDESQLENALLNLAINARDAMPGGGRLRIESIPFRHSERKQIREGRYLERGEYARITVSDEGTGIGEDIRKNIFEPFFTTKAPGKGTGMGLPSVMGTVEEHGGTITFDSEPGRGTSFHIYLPLVQTP